MTELDSEAALFNRTLCDDGNVLWSNSLPRMVTESRNLWEIIEVLQWRNLTFQI